MSAQQAATIELPSVYQEAVREAERHKWIESQKRGCDAGGAAISEWYQRYWNRYYRHRRLEHLKGAQRWIEFNDERFGKLSDLVDTSDLLVDRILDRYYSGFENLTLINWAYDWGLPVDRVMQILELLDVNRSRLDHGNTAV